MLASIARRFWRARNHQNDLDPEAYVASQMFLMTSPSVCKLALSQPKVARLDCFSGLTEKEKLGAIEAMIYSHRMAEFVELRCRNGSPEEKALVLNALADS